MNLENMKQTPDCLNSKRRAFTLIEMLAVIAIIATLAALIVPAVGIVSKKRKIAVAQAELGQIQSAIESYKAKTGFYPPDNHLVAGNAVNAVTNQLYYELEGTILTNIGGVDYYVTIDGNSQIPVTGFPALYGQSGVTTVTGFANSSRNTRSSDEAAAAVNFLTKGLRPLQIAQLASGGKTLGVIIVCSVPWEDASTPPISSSVSQAPPTVNPWRYISSNPTNNTGTYDLWVDILIRGVTNRICNWSKQALINPP